jgi:hypothetical protein
MKMAKAPKEHVDKLRTWLQFTDELSQIEPENSREWEKFKEDWQEDEDFGSIIKHCEDDEGRFIYDYYFDYYRGNISHIHMRVVFGYEVLVDNVCDPDLDYLEFKPELKKLLENEN